MMRRMSILIIPDNRTEQKKRKLNQMRLSVIQKIREQLSDLCASHGITKTLCWNDDRYDPEFNYNGDGLIYVTMMLKNEKVTVDSITFVFDMNGEFTNQKFNYRLNEYSGMVESFIKKG